jgi:hypothetical protein
MRVVSAESFVFDIGRASELKLQNERRDEGRVVAFDADVLWLSLIAVEELHLDVEVLHDGAGEPNREICQVIAEVIGLPDRAQVLVEG